MIAINILGPENDPTASQTDIQYNLNNDPEYFSPYYDLSFTMYVDTEIADIVREMDIKKRLAVKSK